MTFASLPPTTALEHAVALGGAAEPHPTVVDPAKFLRVVATTWSVLHALEPHDVDAAAARRLDDLRRELLDDLEAALAPEVAAELRRLVASRTDVSPTLGELRVLHAQLGGWLSGVLVAEEFLGALWKGAEHEDQ